MTYKYIRASHLSYEKGYWTLRGLTNIWCLQKVYLFRRIRDNRIGVMSDRVCDLARSLAAMAPIKYGFISEVTIYTLVMLRIYLMEARNTPTKKVANLIIFHAKCRPFSLGYNVLWQQGISDQHPQNVIKGENHLSISLYSGSREHFYAVFMTQWVEWTLLNPHLTLRHKVREACRWWWLIMW